MEIQKLFIFVKETVTGGNINVEDDVCHCSDIQGTEFFIKPNLHPVGLYKCNTHYSCLGQI